MKNLQNLLKVMEENKSKHIIEYVKMRAKHNFADRNMTTDDYLKIGILIGKIEEAEELEKTIKLLIKKTEDEDKLNAKYEQALIGIEEVMNILPVLVALKVIE